MSDLTRQLSEATWVPKARRASALAVLGNTSPGARALLSFALETRLPAAVEQWLLLARQVLPKDPGRRLTPELLQHVISVAGARTVRPVVLREAIDAVLGCDSAQLPGARAALTALGSGVSLANAHAIYLSATRKAPKASLPTTAPHLGGPVPELSVFETVEVSLTLAHLALDRQPGKEGARLVALAEQQLSWARGGKRGVEPTKRGDEPEPAKKLGPAFALARAALMEARNIEHVSGRGTSIKSAVGYGLELGDAGWWLSAVDEAVMLGDARTAWERRGQQTSRHITHVTWRGGDATARLWLARLDGGTYALLAKLGRAWTSSEGDLEAVTATLPDAWFGRAMPVINARMSAEVSG